MGQTVLNGSGKSGVQVRCQHRNAESVQDADATGSDFAEIGAVDNFLCRCRLSRPGGSCTLQPKAEILPTNKAPEGPWISIYLSIYLFYLSIYIYIYISVPLS